MVVQAAGRASLCGSAYGVRVLSCPDTPLGLLKSLLEHVCRSITGLGAAWCPIAWNPEWLSFITALEGGSPTAQLLTSCEGIGSGQIHGEQVRKEQGTRCNGGKTGWDWEDRQFPAGGEDGARWHRVADGIYVASLHYSRPNAGVGLLRPRGHSRGEEIRSFGCLWVARLPGDPSAGGLPRNPAVLSGDAGGGLRGGRQGLKRPSTRGEYEGCFPLGCQPPRGAVPPWGRSCRYAPALRGRSGAAGAGAGAGSGPGPGPGGRRSRAAAAPSAGAALTRQLVVGAVQVAGVGQALLPAFAPHLLRGGGGGTATGRTGSAAGQGGPAAAASPRPARLREGGSGAGARLGSSRRSAPPLLPPPPPPGLGTAAPSLPSFPASSPRSRRPGPAVAGKLRQGKGGLREEPLR